MRARLVRAGLATSGTLGLILTGLYGPLGVGSARERTRTTNSGARLETPAVHVDAIGGACPSGTATAHIGPGLEACRPTAPSPRSECTHGDLLDAIHVAPGAHGSGSPSDPMGSIEEALRASRGRPVVLTSSGPYDAPRSAVEGRVIGPCGAEVTIVGSLELTGGARVEHVRIEGAVHVSGEVLLSDVRVRAEGELPAIALSGADAALTFARLRVRSRSGAALSLSDGAHVRGDVLDARGGDVTLRARGTGTEATFDHAELSASRSTVDAIALDDGATLTVTHSTIEAGSRAAVAATGARLAAEDVIVTGQADALVLLAAGSQASLRNVALLSASTWAIDASASTLVARGFVVSSQIGSTRGADGGAVRAHDGAQASLEEGLVTAVHGRAVVVSGSGTSVRAEHLEITRTRTTRCATSFLGCDGPPGGHALAVTDGARLEVSGSRMIGSDGCGLFVEGARSRVSLSTSELRDNRVAMCGDGASGDWLSLAHDVELAANESLLARPRLASLTPPGPALRALD